MTAILAIYDYDKESMIFASDRRVSENGFRTYGKCAPKVTRKEMIMFGIAGSAELGDLIQHAWKAPIKPEDMTNYEYVRYHVIPSLEKLINRDLYECTDSQMILAIKGDDTLYTILFTPIKRTVNLIELTQARARNSSSYDEDDDDTEELDVDLTLCTCVGASAIGSGGMYALAAFNACRHFTDTLNAAHRAIIAAASVDPGCDDEVDVFQLASN